MGHGPGGVFTACRMEIRKKTVASRASLDKGETIGCFTMPGTKDDPDEYVKPCVLVDGPPVNPALTWPAHAVCHMGARAGSRNN